MGLFGDAVTLTDGRVLFVPSDARYASIFDPSTGNLTTLENTDLGDGTEKFSSGILLPDGRVACVPLRLDHVYLLDPADGDAFTQSSNVRPSGYASFERLYSDCVLLADGSVLLVPHEIGQLGVWDQSGSTPTFEILSHDPITSPELRGQLLPDGTVFLVSRQANHPVWRWDPRDPIGIQEGPVWDRGVNDLILDDRGFLLASSATSSDVLRWSLQTGPTDPAFMRFVS